MSVALFRFAYVPRTSRRFGIEWRDFIGTLPEKMAGTARPTRVFHPFKALIFFPYFDVEQLFSDNNVIGVDFV